MESLSAAANTESDSDPTTHVSIGAAEGTVGSIDISWDTLPVPGSPATPPRGQVGTATAPGQPAGAARAPGSATDKPPPPHTCWN